METHTATIAAAVTVEKIGRRHYLTGDTYAHKDAIRDAGCKWDPDQRSWWTGKAAVAAELVEAIASAPVGPLEGYPTKLPSGDWGARIMGSPEVGATVRIRTRAGKTWDALVEAVHPQGDGSCVVKTRREATASSPQPSRSAQVPVSAAPRPRYRTWRPCGYPGCSQHYCDECDGEGYIPGR
jgi:hypothetical protein